MSYTVGMGEDFGRYIRERRLALGHTGTQYSLRQVATTVGVTPSFLSKVERGELPPPSEETIKRLAASLGENSDVLLAMAGKVSSELKGVILKRPQLFAELIQQVGDAPEQAIVRIVREVRNGKW